LRWQAVPRHLAERQPVKRHVFMEANGTQVVPGQRPFDGRSDRAPVSRAERLDPAGALALGNHGVGMGEVPGQLGDERCRHEWHVPRYHNHRRRCDAHRGEYSAQCSQAGRYVRMMAET
jgi:hypothetical protein